jgi:hypothetical protein
MCVVVSCLLSAGAKIRESGCGNSFKLNFWRRRHKQIILRLHNGDADSEKTGFMQLVSCNVKLQLHEPSVLFPYMKRHNAYTDFQLRNCRNCSSIDVESATI